MSALVVLCVYVIEERGDLQLCSKVGVNSPGSDRRDKDGAGYSRGGR